MPPMKLLLDGHICRPVSWRREHVVEDINWAGRTFAVPNERWLLNDAAPGHSWLRAQHEALPIVAELARTGRIECFETPETRFESMGRAAPIAPYWEGVPIKLIQAAVERIMWWSAADEKNATRLRKRAFLDRISDPRFHELLGAVGHKHQSDCLHVLSAERASLDAFLTMDGKFQRQFTQAVGRRKLVCSVRVLTPAELLHVVTATPSATPTGSCGD